MKNFQIGGHLEASHCCGLILFPPVTSSARALEGGGPSSGSHVLEHMLPRWVADR